MSIEYRPACPSCGKALVFQPSARTYRCNECRETYEQLTAREFPKVEITVWP